MQDTGRLRATLRPEAAAALRPPRSDARTEAVQELVDTTAVDRAHVVMLVEQGIVEAGTARRLLAEIRAARADGFADVVARPAPRGTYLAWEDHLRERLGPEGGMLHAGRSRNDLNATVAALALRRTWVAEGDALADLVSTLVTTAARWRDVVLPAYTNGQPAAPITLAHWLCALGLALSRDLDDWAVGGARRLGRCPLGAGAVAGTTLPIDPARTAELLGFSQPLLSSVDAVATRDAHLRLLGVGVSVTATLTRAAQTVLTWTDPVVGFARLPDDLSGSSSNMPQKRNAYLLEHVTGAHGAALGAYVATVTAMAQAPFTNSVAVGTEALSNVPAGMAALGRSVRLSALVLDGLMPDRRRMVAVAERAFTAASAVAEQLMASTDLSFRDAHHLVGALVGELEAAGLTFRDAAMTDLPEGDVVRLPPSQPGAVVAACTARGGPNEETLLAGLAELERVGAQWTATRTQAQERWAAAERRLEQAERALLAEAGAVR